MDDRTSANRTTPPPQDRTVNDDSQPEGRQERTLVVHPQSSNNGFLNRFRRHFLVAGLALLFSPLTWMLGGESPVDPTDYAERTRRILTKTPLIDGHNDLAWQLRLELHNRIYDGRIDLTKRLLGHTDLLRMREGMVGGQFWSVYVDCDIQQQTYEDPSWTVRDTLEQIDVTRRFINEHPNDLSFCDNPKCARDVFNSGKIASMIGIEGSHQVGSSIANIRQMFNLSARYITLTHNCDNAFATAATTVINGGEDGGLTELGRGAVREMNRLGMMVDLSHVSHQTMRDVLSIAEAPVIFSHSGSYSVHPHMRNVPDDVLRIVKQKGGIVMANFAGRFLNMNDPNAATIHDVVDHVFRIAEVCGWDCVGVGSDFSGTRYIPHGLEDVSKFPNLIHLLMERGATDEQIKLFAGDNLLRVWAAIEQRATEIQAEGKKPVEEESETRWWHTSRQGEPSSRQQAMANGATQKHRQEQQR